MKPCTISTQSRMRNCTWPGRTCREWCKCKTHSESISKYNGFLLTPNLDRLFDGGYISFDDDGKLLISSLVPESEMDSFGLRPDMRLRKIEEGHRPYLAYHRKEVFRNGYRT